ncbi:hypothetical protein EV213_1057 [Aureibacillus halotolerans]|uniref:DUF6434 domain-containing protein n=2 Tax=Aureibacillus halotolerans TaxID=1508390 RepID=A0A4R6U4N1_9BACI|nr:hypothetical protein EV213_1057 [Aureibacillus halotolerans]
MKEIDVDQFNEYYWLKEELQQFSRAHGLSATGSKIELSKRIEVFLKTGRIEKPIRKATGAKKTEAPHQLSLNTVITENHRCSQHVRAFFKNEIPKFHFSTYIQDYFRTNVGKTYRDVITAWHEEEIRKKDPSYKREIGPQFEYNLFISDFFSDPKNQGRSRKEAISAWNKIKQLPGSNKYASRSEV